MKQPDRIMDIRQKIAFARNDNKDNETIMQVCRMFEDMLPKNKTHVEYGIKEDE